MITEKYSDSDRDRDSDRDSDKESDMMEEEDQEQEKKGIKTRQFTAYLLNIIITINDNNNN